MIAKFVKELEGWASDARLFELSPELEGNQFVVVSQVKAEFSGWETYIFSSDKNGRVDEFTEIGNSQRGVISHEDILKEIGYEIK